MLLASVKEISTWVSFLVGPKTDIFNSPLGPITFTLSTQANWPGWDKSFLFVNWWPSPNKVAKSLSLKWICLAEVSTINIPSIFFSSFHILILHLFYSFYHLMPINKKKIKKFFLTFVINLLIC